MNITGLENLNVDEIECYSLKTNYISNDELNTLKGSNINLTLQSQINTLNQYVSNGSSGGGFFSLLCGSINGFVSINPYWNFGGAGVSNINIPVVHNFDFKVNSITFNCQSIPSTQATVQLYKNGNVVYTMPNINTLTNTFNNMNVLFSAGDTLNLYTQSGSGGGLVRCTISCSVGGVVGATPQLSIGTVSSLSSTSQPTVSITGNTLNPVLNFGLVQGIQGIQGVQGIQGIQGQKGDKGDTGDSSFQTQLNTDAIIALGITCGGLQTEIDGIGTTILGIQGEIEGLGTDIGTINEDLATLDGKTQYMTANTATITTNFSSKVTATGDISTTGYLSSLNHQETATSETFGLSTNASTNIQGSNIYVGSLGSIVYIGGIAYNPFSATSSFSATSWLISFFVNFFFSFIYKVNSISFTCQTIPTTQAILYLYKNGSIVYTMPNINALINTFNNHECNK